MFTYLIGILAVWLASARSASVTMPLGTGTIVHNFTDTGERPLKVEMHGQQNYHASQQIFYFYGPQHMRSELKTDYVVSPGLGAHKLHTRKVTWNKARKACIEEGGHLAIINSDAEEKILLRMMDDVDLFTAWLGVHDLFESGDWVTLKDEALGTSGYSRWSRKNPNGPNNASGQQRCGVLEQDGGMNDVDCRVSNAFFCEVTFF